MNFAHFMYCTIHSKKLRSCPPSFYKIVPLLLLDLRIHAKNVLNHCRVLTFWNILKSKYIICSQKDGYHWVWALSTFFFLFLNIILLTSKLNLSFSGFYDSTIQSVIKKNEWKNEGTQYFFQFFNVCYRWLTDWESDTGRPFGLILGARACSMFMGSN